HLQGLHRFPIEAQLGGHIADRRAAAAATDVEGETSRVEGVVRQPGQRLALHGAALRAVHAPHLELQEHAGVATGQVADAARLVIVEGSLQVPTGATRRFFRKRRKDTTRAIGSPKMPWTLASGRKPGNRYVSSSRLVFRM